MGEVKFGPMVGIRDVFGAFLVEAGAENEKIVVLDGDVSNSTRSEAFERKFPERFFNMGISEADMIGTAAGLALGGLIPIVSSFAIFLTGKPWEQIRQSICYMNLNVKLVSSHAGITVGADGATHQIIEDISIMRTLPNMHVIVPADGIEARGAFETALRHFGPFYIRGSREKFPTIMPEDYKFELGVSYTMREGRDATIIACGLMVSKALLAAQLLEGEGMDVRVINMASIKPIDEGAIIRAAEETGAIITAEEHLITGGLGSAAAEVLVTHQPVPMEMVGVRDKFGTSGRPEELFALYGLTERDIANRVREAIRRKR